MAPDSSGIKAMSSLSLSSQDPKDNTAIAKSLQSCPTLCNPIDGSPPGSPISGILQARTLEWVAISFSNAWKWKVKGKLLSSVRLLATPWIATYQAPPPMGFSRHEYWSGVPLPSLPRTIGLQQITAGSCTKSPTCPSLLSPFSHSLSHSLTHTHTWGRLAPQLLNHYNWLQLNPSSSI